MHSLENKEVLCIVPDVEDKRENYIIYVDGTWRFSKWVEDDFSQWKLVKNVNIKGYTFAYRHLHMKKWEDDYEENGLLSKQDKALVEQIQMELFFRKLFTDEAETET
jgi:hypothetical protein